MDMTHKNRIVCYRIIVHANAINKSSFTNISFFHNELLLEIEIDLETPV